MKKLLLFLVASFGLCRVSAQTTVTDYTRVLVWDDAGTYTTLLCVDHPTVRIVGNDLVITVNGATLSYAAERVRKFTFPANGEGQEDDGMEMVKEGVTVHLTVTELTLTKLPEGTMLRIYDAAGRLRLTQAAVGGCVHVVLGDLPPGIYVVQAGKSNFKFQRP